MIYIGHFNDYDEQELIEALKELRAACENNSEHIRDVVKGLVRTYHPEDAPLMDSAASQEEATSSQEESIPCVTDDLEDHSLPQEMISPAAV